MLSYYSTDKQGNTIMDKDFIFLLCSLNWKAKDDDDQSFSELLTFITCHCDSDAIALLSEEQKALFDEKIATPYVTEEKCDICDTHFSWKDMIFIQFREKDGKRVPYHPYCLIRERPNYAYYTGP